MSRYAVKCEKTLTFYIDVYAENEWKAQHKAEYIFRNDDGGGYGLHESTVTARSAVEVDDD
jgi:hypothetical protein